VLRSVLTDVGDVDWKVVGDIDGVCVGGDDGVEVGHSMQEHDAKVGLNHDVLKPNPDASSLIVDGQNPVDVPSMNSYQNISFGG
jgi:hypothetical protein